MLSELKNYELSIKIYKNLSNVMNVSSLCAAFLLDDQDQIITLQFHAVLDFEFLHNTGFG